LEVERNFNAESVAEKPSGALGNAFSTVTFKAR
jgi:hypothetical protein